MPCCVPEYDRGAPPALRSSRTYVARTRYKLQNYRPTYLPTLTTRTGAGRTTYLPTLPPHRDAGKTPTYLPTSYVRCFWIFCIKSLLAPYMTECWRRG